MAERLHPGVYVEEVSGGVRPIEGVSTSTAAFVGEAARGIPGLPQFLTSFAEYERAFGGHRPGDDGLLAAAVDGFFAAGGKRAYVVRVLPKDAVKAQSAEVRARGSFTSPIPALKFVARGAGKWADAIRINILEATNFKDDAFRIDVFWTENGASRRVESFDEVRMDPSHEDYVGERLRNSRYIEVEDLFAKKIDEETDPVVVPEAPVLAARKLEGTARYLMYENKVLTVTWWDASQPDATPVKQEIKFDQALLDTLGATAPKFTNASAQLKPADLAKLLNAKLDKLDAPATANPPSIGFKIGKAPVVAVKPAAGTTWDLAGQKLRITVNDGTPVEITVPAANPAQTKAEEIADAINDSDAGVKAVAAPANTVTVTGKFNEAAVPTLTIVSTPTAANITTTPTAGVQGLDTERIGGLRVSLSESITASAPAVLRALGFPAAGRGHAADSLANPKARPLPTVGLRLAGGSDGGDAGITASDYEGDARERTGLHALDGVDVNLVALPGKNEVAFISIGVAYCDRRGDCFYLLDGPGGADRQVVVKPDDAKQFIESLPSRSKNAAMFYPWIQIPDPVGVGRNPTRFVPPSGHVAGIFARTDVTRGVWKAPAGIEATVPEAVGLQYYVLDAEQDLLNPVSLNCLRQFPGVGIVSWGTRTLSSDPEWRYVPVRRMGLFLRESLRRGLQWAVFEPNDEELWGRIAINVKAFMMTLFRQGAFQGATPEEAFAVVCDRSTNPQENIDAGIVTAKVAWAPLKPAEFVVIEVSQKSLLVS